MQTYAITTNINLNDEDFTLLECDTEYETVPHDEPLQPGDFYTHDFDVEYFWIDADGLLRDTSATKLDLFYDRSAEEYFPVVITVHVERVNA